MRELVQRAQEQAAENERLHIDHAAMSVRFDEIALAIGLLAARIPALVDALPDIRMKLGSDACEALDRTLEHANQEQRNSQNESCAAATSASAVRANESHQALSGALSAATTCTEPVADVPVTDARKVLIGTSPEHTEQHRKGVTGGGGASAEVLGAVPSLAFGADRERQLDQFLDRLVADDARFEKLGASLLPAEVMMLIELSLGIGLPSDGKRMKILDALLVSLSDDETRLKRINAFLTPAELDLLATLGRGMPELKFSPSSSSA